MQNELQWVAPHQIPEEPVYSCDLVSDKTMMYSGGTRVRVLPRRYQSSGSGSGVRWDTVCDVWRGAGCCDTLAAVQDTGPRLPETRTPGPVVTQWPLRERLDRQPAAIQFTFTCHYGTQIIEIYCVQPEYYY